VTPSARDAAFFRPLWRRVAVVAALALWTAVELAFGDATWATITGAILAYSVWTFLISFPKEEEKA
jgi:hypothetical protein